VSKVDEYTAALGAAADWFSYLRSHSGLPGPRGNLELAHAFAASATRARIDRLIEADPPETNTPEEFLVFCGVLGLGALAAKGDRSALAELRPFAGSRSWRVREAAAMALQLIGDAHPRLLASTAKTWAKGTWLERRAAAAGVAEPRLLKDRKAAGEALALLDNITADMDRANETDRKSEDYRVLRQGMAYCWSVVVAALPEEGKTAMERWLGSADPDIGWLMRENLKKGRLVKMDPAWVERWSKRLAK
jgi:hypothetical protein